VLLAWKPQALQSDTGLAIVPPPATTHPLQPPRHQQVLAVTTAPPPPHPPSARCSWCPATPAPLHRRFSGAHWPAALPRGGRSEPPTAPRRVRLDIINRGGGATAGERRSPGQGGDDAGSRVRTCVHTDLAHVQSADWSHRRRSACFAASLSPPDHPAQPLSLALIPPTAAPAPAPAPAQESAQDARPGAEMVAHRCR
jgi:hypothetical protein